MGPVCTIEIDVALQIPLQAISLTMRVLENHQPTHFEADITERRPEGVKVKSAPTHEDNIAVAGGPPPSRDSSEPGKIVVRRLLSQKTV